MNTVMVRYKVKAGRVAENERLVREVYAELKREAPRGLRYATFKLEDGVTFVHIAAVDTADGSNPLSKMTAFKAFQEGIKERCAEPPAPASLNEVGSFRFFA